MKTLALKNGDIYFEKGELALVEGKAEVDQNVYVLMKVNKEEWFLDLDEGLDYKLLFDKTVSEDVKREEIYNRLISDDRIESVESIEFDFNRKTRKLEITFRAVAIDSEVIEGMVNINAR